MNFRWLASVAAVLALAACSPTPGTRHATERESLSEQIGSGALSGESLAMAYLKRGFAFQRDKHFESALADYNQAAAAAPQMALAYNMRGYLLLFLGRFDEALADSAQMIALSPPTEAHGHVLRAAILVAKHDSTGALAAYDEALARDPKSLFAYAGRGKVLADLGEEDRALADFDEAVALYPLALRRSTIRHCYRFGAQTTPHCDSQEFQGTDLPTAVAMVGVHQRRGTIFFERGDYMRAAADLKEGGYDGDTAVKAALASFAIGNCEDGRLSLRNHEAFNKIDRASVIATHRDFIAKTPCADVLDD